MTRDIPHFLCPATEVYVPGSRLMDAGIRTVNEASTRGRHLRTARIPATVNDVTFITPWYDHIDGLATIQETVESFST